MARFTPCSRADVAQLWPRFMDGHGLKNQNWAALPLGPPRPAGHPLLPDGCLLNLKNCSSSNWHASRMDSGVIPLLPPSAPLRTRIQSFPRSAPSLRARHAHRAHMETCPYLLTSFAIEITATHRRLLPSLCDSVHQKLSSCNLLILRSDCNLTNDNSASPLPADSGVMANQAGELSAPHTGTHQVEMMVISPNLDAKARTQGGKSGVDQGDGLVGESEDRVCGFAIVFGGRIDQ